jgi:pSer/pThr/pTyr-binding forkhead associated (FHA) protein
MAVRLRYLAHDLEVPLGQFVIGRTSDCQLSLDDPLVSRRHAVLTVELDGVFIDDLESRNGVFLNGQRVEQRARVADGDAIRIGSQEITLYGIGDVPSRPASQPRNLQASTMQDVRLSDILPDEDVQTSILTAPMGSVEPDKRVHGLSLIGAVADKALAMGRAEEAERILQRALNDALAKAGQRDLLPEFAEKAAHYAIRLAQGTGKGPWVDYVFELYTGLGTLLPGRLVDDLYAVGRKVKHIDKTRVRAYMACLREISHGFGPTERFIQQRIEGFERWAP